MTIRGEEQEMVSGDTKTLRFTIANDGVPVDLSSAASIRCGLSKGSSVLVEKTLASGITVSGDDNNIILVPLQPADTAPLKGVYRVEVEVIDGAGNVSTTTQGTLTIHKDDLE